MKSAALALCVVAAIFFPLSLHAKGKSDKKSKTPTVAPSPVQKSDWTMIAGTGDGLFSIDSAAGASGGSSGKRTALWQGGSVKKILYVPEAPENTEKAFWVILGSEGIFVSNDLQKWEPRNQGLPIKTIKVFHADKKTFLPMVQEIKDLEFNPADPNVMVCATKDSVYLSRDQGQSWASLGAPPYRTNGIKAVASAYLPTTDSSGNDNNELTVFLSHSTYGIYYYQPGRRNAQWIELAKGLETLETTGNPDEVADISVMRNSKNETEMYVSQTFRRRIYKLDWHQKKFDLVWSDSSPFGTVDSLNAGNASLDFLYEGTVASVDYADFTLRKRQDILDGIKTTAAQDRINCVAMKWNAMHENKGGNSDWLLFSELWLLDEQEPESNNGTKPAAANAMPQFNPAALNKEGIYLPVNHAMDSHSLRPYLNVIERGGLNMIVIDMKDDYGRLRFTPNNPAISAKGRVFRPLDIDALLQDMKSRGIFTAARVVVFKDPELAAKENGRFAVWDIRNAKPWAGYYDSRRKKSDISAEDRRDRLLQFFPANDPNYEIVRTFYDEKWVDPYSEEVWEYIAATAEELHERGFDEIQFDYIRFPTDGENIGDARFRWQENGMDRESAILSFLRHIRGRVTAPISIDIYGANGWYRTGARTGQEVELLAPWVDVISPMYYPSHFEQHFLAQNPAELRPLRIYYQGTLRTARIARGQAIIRPYAQAFFLNVSYDRKYYNPDYVRYQLEGVRAAGNGGLTYWNNSGRYDDIPSK